jgi:hypothetical protein
MKKALQTGAALMSRTILEIVANVDPEVLQWPGGSIFATLLAICATIPPGGRRTAQMRSLPA